MSVCPKNLRRCITVKPLRAKHRGGGKPGKGSSQLDIIVHVDISVETPVSGPDILTG